MEAADSRRAGGLLHALVDLQEPRDHRAQLVVGEADDVRDQDDGAGPVQTRVPIDTRERL